MNKSIAMLVLLADFGCTPSLPDELPASSPASESAKPAPLPTVGLSLVRDPPLPGEPADGWVGLGAASGHDMSGHDMSGMNMGGMHDMSGMQMGMPDAGMMKITDGGMMHGR